ncbi:hypothetical protein DCS_02801 [Drechmeria coniospora]|uniref:Uncharacterized protein n=1 Tax=Drechmeria coniospora TaxID=98403 RepID=A0A151GX32_DRECN|nr:hypothetical protein DCS_02801 [Drechmeria coniospora]KYK61658.1 hypothetical protein DCS_02801 [Drechmeria coniospora]
MVRNGGVALLLSLSLAWSVGVDCLAIESTSSSVENEMETKPETVTESPDRLYRVDTRTPATIWDAGGFLPWAALEDPEADFSVYDHALGPSNQSVYVSTTSDLDWALAYAEGIQGYIYAIDPTENMFCVADSLRANDTDIQQQLEKHLRQKEWVALGGIRGDQISGVARAPLNGQNYDVKFSPFNGYNKSKYSDGHAASGPQPELAGFPLDGQAGLELRPQKVLSAPPLREAGMKLMDTAMESGWEKPADSQGRSESIKDKETGMKMTGKEVPASARLRGGDADGRMPANDKKITMCSLSPMTLEKRRGRGGGSGRSFFQRPAFSSRQGRPAGTRNRGRKTCYGLASAIEIAFWAIIEQMEKSPIDWDKASTSDGTNGTRLNFPDEEPSPRVSAFVPDEVKEALDQQRAESGRISTDNEIVREKFQNVVDPENFGFRTQWADGSVTFTSPQKSFVIKCDFDRFRSELNLDSCYFNPY